jgi:hypothetical protein
MAMLSPEERVHLLELVRPPDGFRLDLSVGTTFSLDLISALMLPLAFTFGWEREGEGEPNPLAILESLREHGHRYTVFCQSGQIRLPQRKHAQLLTFLEPCIYDVQAREPGGVFHPKVWALRYTGEGGSVRYRVLCLSRNLTFDRSWDTAVVLDGELTERERAFAVNHPLGDFIAALPSLSTRELPKSRRDDIKTISEELRRVRFEWPNGFDTNQCRFWVGGLDGKRIAPFDHGRGKALIVSPFVDESVVRESLNRGYETHLVSRPESLRGIPCDTLRNCASVRILKSEAVEPEDDVVAVDRNDVLDGLHAKLFVVDDGWNASVYSGSFNATNAALERNVEFMVELVGKRSYCGVDRLLQQVKGETNFADMLQAFDVSAVHDVDDMLEQQLDTLLMEIKRKIADARPLLKVTASDKTDHFDMTLEWKKPPQWNPEEVDVAVWPITQLRDRAMPGTTSIMFAGLNYEGLTPLIAFAVTVRRKGAYRESLFVMNLPMSGAPEDRADLAMRSLIANGDNLIRHILFLLAVGDNESMNSGALEHFIEQGANGAAWNGASPFLLETMLRALYRSPGQLRRVASLLETLRKQPDSSDLLTPDFEEIWSPIWSVGEGLAK